MKRFVQKTAGRRDLKTRRIRKCSILFRYPVVASIGGLNEPVPHSGILSGVHHSYYLNKKSVRSGVHPGFFLCLKYRISENRSGEAAYV